MKTKRISFLICMLIILMFLISSLSINSVFAPKNRKPIADVGGPYSGTEGEAISFDGSGSNDKDGTIISFLWDFGDGETSTNQNPTHVYSQNGSYSVSLLVTDNENATDEHTTSVVVADTDPVSDFSASPLSGTEPLTVTFIDLSTSHDGIISWLWDFGDGQTSKDQNPIHEYTQGTYTVSLTITEADSYSGTETKTEYITVADSDPVSDFSASPTSGIPTLTVTFIDASASFDGVISWLWEFGDGKSSTEPNPTHSYTIGSFTVSLTIREEDGDTKTQTKPNYINVEPSPNSSPTADFIIAFSAMPTINDIISFTDNSVDTDGRIISWAWNFGDTTTSTTQNPVHRYQSTGTYVITLIVQDDDGATATKTKQLTIHEINPPVTTNDYDGLWHNIDFIINLTATDDNSGVAETYYKINAYPTKQLSIDGPPIITTEDSNNTLEYWSIDKIGNQETHHILLDIKLDKTPPTADPGENITIAEDTPITFNAQQSKDNIQITNYTWTLIDGTYQELNGKNPQYIFNTPGVYTANLTVTDAANNSAMNPLIITVTDITNPIANAGDDKIINEGTSVIFNGSASTDNVGIAGYNWNFLDSSPQTLIGVDPIYTFDSVGIYEITLTVSDAQGNSGTDILLITVIDSIRPVADAGTDQVIMEDSLVNFNGSSSTDNVGIVSYVWIFTDDKVQTLYGEETSYIFKNPGVYVVVLTVSDAKGHSSNDTTTIIVTDNTMLSIDKDDDTKGISDALNSIKDLDQLDLSDAAIDGNMDGVKNIEEKQSDADAKVHESEEDTLSIVLVVAVIVTMIGYGLLLSLSKK